MALDESPPNKKQFALQEMYKCGTPLEFSVLVRTALIKNTETIFVHKWTLLPVGWVVVGGVLVVDNSGMSPPNEKQSEMYYTTSQFSCENPMNFHWKLKSTYDNNMKK